MNGRVVLSVKSKSDLNRLLEVSPSSVRAVVMHDGPTVDQLELTALRRELEACRARAEDTDRSRHAYKTENVRLSHRVSYLEDQVSELIKCRSAAALAQPTSNGVQLFQRGSNSAMVRSKSPKHGVSAIQQYKRKQVVYDDCIRPAAAQEGPVKTRIRTVPRLYGSSASVESLASSTDAVVAAKSYDDLHGVASPKRNRYPGGGGGGRNSSRTRHIREAQQTLFRFLDSESSGGNGATYLLQQCGGSGGTASPTTCSTGGGSVRSLDLQQDAVDPLPHHRLKSNEYYSHVTAAATTAESPRPSRSLNYDSEQSSRRGAPMPPKKPMRLSLQQRHRKNDGVADADCAASTEDEKRHKHHHLQQPAAQQLQQHHHHRRSRDDDDVDLSAMNNTMS